MSSIAAAPGFAAPRSAAVRRPTAGARSTAPVTVRLTRRGRLVLLVAFVALAFVALTVFVGESAATGKANAPMQTRTVEVGEGDNLWQIASTVAEPGEVREMIHQIEELNALSGVGLVEGQEIAVPVG